MKYKIYKLEYNNEVIYVGMTIQDLKRRKAGGYPNIPKEIVIKSVIYLIEETDDIIREEYWINYYKDKGYYLYNKRRGDGVDNKEYMKYWYEKNKEIVNKNHRDYYNINKEKIIKRHKLWQENNKDKVKKIKKNYYEKKKLLQK